MAIDFSLKNFNVDKEKIYVIGGSGGGYTALAMFIHSRHKIASISAWCAISDIRTWFHQTKIRGWLIGKALH
jgi:predicted peptidase